MLLSLYRRAWRTIGISAQKCATATGRATICESARARPEAPVDVTFGHFEAHVANAVVPDARLCARYTSPDVICRVFSQTHRVTCAVVRSRRRTSENVSVANKCPSSSLWWLSIEVIFARRRRHNHMTRTYTVETKSSCRFPGTHCDFRDRAIGHCLIYICPKMVFFGSAARF